MDYESFYAKLNGYHPLSSPLRAYLKVVLREIFLADNNAVETSHWKDYPLMFVSKGTLKTKLESKVEPGRSLLLFHFEGMMLPQFLERNQEDFQLKTTAIGETILIAIPSGHLHNLYKLFPEFHKVIEGITLNNFTELFHLAFDIKNVKSDDRLATLLKLHPNIFQLAPSIDIADSIGMHAHTLSTLKNKYFKNK
ncbi:hypothetical protein [Pedobacter sp. R-06]|uniref:hypothetical protein n=1 Tax=Pedobacter sp. R-06 TaxID=3404051 RepID=UPI003CEC9FCC